MFLDAVIKAVKICEKWDADGRNKEPREDWEVTEITHGALICKKSVDAPPYIRGYRKTSANQTFCFTKNDLPPNAIFPGNPVTPSSDFGNGGGSENGDHNRKKRQSEKKIIHESLKSVNVLSSKTHAEIFSFGRNPERWLTKNPNYNYTCDLARLIVWKDGGNEFAKLSQERYQNVTVSTKAGKYYGLRYEDCEFGVDFPLCGEWK